MDIVKKKVAIYTDAPKSSTGLGRNGKALLKHLINCGRYEISYFAHGYPWSHPDMKKLPVRTFGCLPDNQQELQRLAQDQGALRDASYGSLNIDKFLKETRPDVLLLSNDSWAFPFFKRPWWNKFHCIPHITLDSTPFLRDQIEFIKASPNFTVWAKFAEEECHRLGFKRVKTIPAMIEPGSFKRLGDGDRAALRKKFNISPDTFICGFVFRSQLRKEIKPLMEGFLQFQKENPEIKNSKLLLHTNFAEGWDIVKLIEDVGLNKEDILTTYVCRDCGNYEVRSFTGQDQPCRFCGSEKGQITCNVMQGITEEQLNEVYNLMDCYCHLANAGGCEMPIIEALYAELPLATVSYSFGKTFTDEDFCYSIDWAKTIQFGTQFDRAAPSPNSVAKFLKKIAHADKSKRRDLGVKGRAFALATFSPEVVGKQWEQLIDSLPIINYDFDFTEKPKNPNYPIPLIEDNDLFIDALYKNILMRDEPRTTEGFANWQNQLKRGISKQQVYEFFINTAREDNAKNTKIELTDLFDKDDVGRRILFVVPEHLTDVFLVTSLFESCKEKYPGCNIYIATKPANKVALKGNPLVHKILDYSPIFENIPIMVGQGDHQGFFEAVFMPTVGTQKTMEYLGNHK